MCQRPTERIVYRPEIDGLRAVAVLSVFVFHLNHKWLPGGFVGVDIFFVISGYLITSILYNDCMDRRFSLSRFYQRRIARIIPAFFTVALATLLGAAFVYSSQDLASAGANLVAATLSLANVKYMLQGDYFEISPDAQPYLHYWSLSVEEQFYMIFPLLLFFIFRQARNYLIPILSLLGIGSFVSCVLATYTNPVWAFYLLPTRAWELGAGGLIAVIISNNNRYIAFLPRWLSTAGLLMIASSILLIQEGSDFPGWQAAFPVLGAMAIILSHSGGGDRVQQLLSSRNMVRIGLISYSLYLWHWPVFSLIDYHFYFQMEWLRLLLKIGLSFIFAIITFRFIEIPARIFLNQPQSRNVSFATMAALLVLCIPLGVSVRNNNYVSATHKDVANGGLFFPGKQGASTVVLMGDSNGSMYGKLLKEICEDLGKNLAVISVAAGDPLPSLNGKSNKLWLDSLETVIRIKPDYLVLASHWTGKLQQEPDRLVIALSELKSFAQHIILLNQPPILPKEANRQHIRNGIRPPFHEVSETREERLKVNALLLNLKSAGVSVIDISHYFEREGGEVMFVDEQGRQLYQDPNHLSGYGAERIRDVLEQIVK